MDHPFKDAYQRAGPIALMPQLLHEFNVHPSVVTEGLQIDLNDLTPNSQLPFTTCLLLLERAADRTGCEHFGLLLGSRYRWAMHGIIRHLADEAPTLREALLDFQAWQLGYASGATVYVHRVGPDFAFGYGIYDRVSAGSRQLYDCTIAVGRHILEELTEGRVSPVEIHLTHVQPRDVMPYVRILKAPLRFNETRSCLIISGTDIDLPRPKADPARRRQVLEQIKATLGKSTQSVTARLRHIIRPQLLREDPSMVGAARAFGLSPRTLRRQLASEGTTFETVRDVVRFMAAQELLDLTNLTLTEIAFSLSFASQSAFSQAFRRWAGTSPSRWRNRLHPRL